jgi:hypothetical protein
MTMKNCEHCGGECPPRKWAGGWPKRFCSKVCRSASHAKTNKDRYAATRKAAHMRRAYNIPAWMAHYLMEHMRTGNCPGCRVKFGPPGSTYGAVIDHDHDTDLVRMIVCNQCNTSRLRNCDDGRNPEALLLAAGRVIKHTGKHGAPQAIIQLRLAALLISHYRGVEVAPAVGRMLAIPLPTT